MASPTAVKPNGCTLAQYDENLLQSVLHERLFTIVPLLVTAVAGILILGSAI